MMDQILTIRLYAAGIGIVVGEFLGSFDDLLYALVVFVATDYITGVLRAIVEKELSSAIGSRGFARRSASSPLSAWRMSSIPTSSAADASCALR